MKDYTGYQNNGCLFVEEAEPKIHKHGIYFQKSRYGKWRCKCGKVFEAKISHIVKGKIQSCGCVRSETNRKLKFKHGCCGRSAKVKKVHRFWESMKRRCLNPKGTHYKDYGGRGIQIYPPWINSFSVFYEWFKNEFGLDDIPAGLSIDRIDCNGNYEPGNLRLATSEIQNNNKRNNRKFIVNGIIECVSSLAKKHNINYNTLYNRIFVSCWPIEKALNTPARGQKSLAITPNLD